MHRLKNIAVVLSAILLWHGTAAAQRVESLVPPSDDWSFYFQPEFKTTQLSGKSAQLAGVRMGPALARTLRIGLAGYALVSSVDPDSEFYQSLKAFDLWFAGLDADYTILPNKLVHASIGCLLGGGQLRAKLYGGGKDDANLFVAEPQANLLFNLTTTVELGFGVSYRFVNGSSLDDLADEDLRGVSGSVFLRWTEAP